MLLVFLVNVHLVGQKGLHALPVTCGGRAVTELLQSRTHPDTPRAVKKPSLFICTDREFFFFNALSTTKGTFDM